MSSRLFRVCFGAGKGRQDIQGNGKHFERQKDNDKIQSLRHKQHAHNAEEQQGVVFAPFEAHALEIAVSQRNTEEACHKQQGIHKGREAVEHNHIVKAGLGGADL